MTLDELRSATDAFFTLHWPQAWGCAPRWSDRWSMQTAIPQPQLPGVYAMARDETVVYIGKGEREIPAGLGIRLAAHVIRAVRRGGPYTLREKWQAAGVTGVYTLAIASERQYLIPALESYLIGHPPGRPEMNQRR
ncbi:hypothetical protein [Ramlibacter sp. AN1133]|uniref:hypothetical protein n=1 Tax=Ramlibacter sp. AN1133 TaxID=3133429 RepID=UPI0030C4542F